MIFLFSLDKTIQYKKDIHIPYMEIRPALKEKDRTIRGFWFADIFRVKFLQIKECFPGKKRNFSRRANFHYLILQLKESLESKYNHFL